MGGSIELFQLFQICQKFLGICPFQADQKPHSIIVKRIIFLFGNAQFLASVTMHIIFEAELMFDFGLSTFQIICSVNGIVVYSLFLWQLENTLQFIENCEKFIEKSKYHSKLLAFYNCTDNNHCKYEIVL